MIVSRFALLGLLLLVQDAAPKVPDYPPPDEVRTAFLKLIDRPKVPLDPKPAEPRAEAREESLSIASEKRPDGEVERVPILILKPEKREGRLPVVIVLHGTGGNKDAVRDWLRPLTQRGFLAVAIDGRHHGDRGDGVRNLANQYNDAIIRAWRSKPSEPMAHPLYYDTAWDVMRTIDYLQTRPDVDPERIGLMGISKGGIETWLAGAVDPRVKVAVPCIAIQSLRWSLDHDAWQGRANTFAKASGAAARDLGEPGVSRKSCEALWSKVLPGILDRFDCPSMLRLFAGRPLLIVGGEEYPNCPLGGAKIAIASTEAAYRAAGCPEKLKVSLAPMTGHAITKGQRELVLDWFSKWL